MRLAPWLLFVSSAVLSSSFSASPEPPAELADPPLDHDGIVAEDDIEFGEYAPPFEAAPPRCCTDADPTDLLVISTMDGKVQALDVGGGGRLVWQSDLDGAALLEGNLGRMEPLSAEGDRFVLVPSLDGGLYMYSEEQRVLEPIPLSTDMLLHSVRIGREAVAGGKSISTTGVDPATGKIRYHCTSAQCEQWEGGGVSRAAPFATLVFRRVSHSLRAADALSGAEKWNLSVSEYEASMVRQRMTMSGATPPKKNTKFVISPPTGTITAVDANGRTLWTTTLGTHIARSWHLEGYDLNEVSLFDSNIHSINNLRQEAGALAVQESLLYLGTLEDDLFILSSARMRKDMSRLTKLVEVMDEPVVDANSRALVKAAGETYQMADGILDEVLGHAFKQSISRLSERRARRRKIAGPTGFVEETEGMKIALPAPDHGVGNSQSCEVPGKGVVIVGEDNVLNAEPHGSSRGDQGWFIVRSSTPAPSYSRSFGGFLAPPSQCTAHFMKAQLSLEADVNPLWRLLAIVLLFVTGVIGMFKIAKLRRRWRDARAVVDESSSLPAEDAASERKWHSAETYGSTSAPFETASDPPSGPAAPVRKAISDDLVAAHAPDSELRRAAEQRTAAAAAAAERRRRKASTRSGASDASATEHFQSTFLRDYDPLRVLGRGGFGVVFEAANKLDQCHYAVKRIAVANNERAIERVLREVRAMAMLDHVGIIRYCHTWLERPPDGWQKEMDRVMLNEMVARRRGEVVADAVDSSVSSVADFSSIHQDDTSLGIIAPPAISERTAEEESWADDNENEAKGLKNSESSSSQDSDDSEQGIIAISKVTERSDSVVFERCLERATRASSSKKSREISRLDTNMLMTSNDEELLPCKSTTDNVFLYIQMQLCHDKTLYAWLLANRTEASREREHMKRWMRQLVAAVDYIHQKGLIHRDIKPQNIFYFCASDSLKIGDLGLVSKGAAESGNGEEEEAKSSSHSSISSLHTDNVGTRTYMSPEQLANLPYTSKVDVFSLGLIFAELNIPFSTLMERSKVLSGLQAGIQPEHLRNEKEIAAFVAWLTSLSPDKRPTCDELLKNEFLSEKCVPCA